VNVLEDPALTRTLDDRERYGMPIIREDVVDLRPERVAPILSEQLEDLLLPR
jgi:hypothetical protein